MNVHRKHHCQPLKGLLEQLAVSHRLPTDVAKEEKDTDSLMDRLISELQSLKQRHKTYFEKRLLSAHKFAGLLQRLLQG